MARRSGTGGRQSYTVVGNLRRGVEIDTFRYVLGVLLMVGLPPGVTWWFLVHPFVGLWRRVGARVTMAAMTLFFVVTLTGLFVVRDWLLGPDLGTRWPLIALGVVLVGIGMTMGIRRRRYLTMRILAGMPEVEAEPERRGRLLCEGPYAVVRHPRYLEIVFATFGYAAIANYLGCWVLALVLFPVLHLVVLLEERELIDRFGEAYREYAVRVPRYLPRRR